MFNTQAIGRATAIAAAIALVAGSAIPAGAAPDPTSEVKTESSRPEVSKTRQVCFQGQIIGSRLTRKICKTRDQWIKETGVDPLERN
ncbi:MAG: hypothetical protein WDN24_15725 [Sphingomonas sp.]